MRDGTEQSETHSDQVSFSDFFALPKALDLSPEPVWFTAALARALAWCSRMEAPLRGRAEQSFARLLWRNGGRCLVDLMRSRWATPFVHLIDSYRIDRNIDENEEQLGAVGEGTLFLYFGVRVQDDIIDEPDTTDVLDHYLADSFFGASTRAFAEVVGGRGGFWLFRDELMGAFHQLSAMEVLARREGRCVTEWADDTINNTIKNSKNNTNKSIQLIGRKFFPMAVPLSAIAFWAGRGMEAGFIREFVEVLGAGLQMVNDIFNIGEDNGAGRRTPVLEELCRTSPVTPDEPIGYVRALLNSSPAMDWAMAGARAHFEKSVRIAMDNDAPSMAAVARRRLESVDAVPSRVLALCLGGRIR